MGYLYACVRAPIDISFTTYAPYNTHSCTFLLFYFIFIFIYSFIVSLLCRIDFAICYLRLSFWIAYNISLLNFGVIIVVGLFRVLHVMLKSLCSCLQWYAFYKCSLHWVLVSGEFVPSTFSFIP